MHKGILKSDCIGTDFPAREVFLLFFYCYEHCVPFCLYQVTRAGKSTPHTGGIKTPSTPSPEIQGKIPNDLNSYFHVSVIIRRKRH